MSELPHFADSSGHSARSEKCQERSSGSLHRLRLLVSTSFRRRPYRKDRALAHFARHSYIAAHHARELAGDGEPQPRSAELLRGCGIGLAELLEQLGLLLRRHADAGVGNGKLDEVAAI